MSNSFTSWLGERPNLLDRRLRGTGIAGRCQDCTFDYENDRGFQNFVSSSNAKRGTLLNSDSFSEGRDTNYNAKRTRKLSNPTLMQSEMLLWW